MNWAQNTLETKFPKTAPEVLIRRHMDNRTRKAGAALVKIELSYETPYPIKRPINIAKFKKIFRKTIEINEQKHLLVMRLV